MHMPRTSTKKPKWRRTFLREWREFREMTLEQAGADIGLKHSQLSRIERGLSPYTQPVLEAASRIYRAPVWDLLNRRPGEAEDLLAIAASIEESERPRAARVLKAIRDE